MPIFGVRRCGALIALLAVAGCGGASVAPKPPGVVHDFEIAGQADVLVTAPHRTDRVVVYVHGANEDASAIETDPLKRPIVDALLNHGYSLAASYAHGENWGDPPSVLDYVRLIARLRGEGFTRVYVLAQSMGGLDALQLIGREKIAAWAALFPVANVQSVAETFPKYDRQIRAAGTAGTLSPVRVTHAHGLRMIFWASPQDTKVLKRLNTDVIAVEAKRHGARVTVITTTGDHGDPSNFQPARLLAFYSFPTEPRTSKKQRRK